MKSFLRKSKSYAVTLMILNLFFAGTAIGQTNTFNNASGNNWNTIANWSLGHVPLAAEDVVIPDNESVTVNTAAVCATLTMGAGGNDVTVSISNGQSLTVTGAVTMNAGTGSSDDRTLAVGAATFSCGSLSMANSGAANSLRITISTGSATVNGNLSMLGSATENLVVFSSTGTLFITGTGTMSGGALTPSTGTVNYSGTNQTIGTYIYTNLTLSGSGTKTLTGVTDINGNMTLSGTVSAATAANFAIDGNLSIGDGTSMTAAGFNFTVLGTTTIDGTLISNSTAGTKTFDNMVISATGVFNSTVDEAYTLTGSLNVNAAGTLTSGSGTWTFNGNSTISGTAAITTALFSTTYSNSGIYSFSSLTVTGSGNFTNNGTINVSTTLAGSDGFIQGPGDILNFGGASITVNAFTATAANNTVNYNGGIQNVRAVAYQNLTLSGTGAKMVTGSTVNLTLSMQGTASATGTSPTFGASATLEYAGSAAQTTTDVEFKSTAVSPLHVIINNSNGVTLHAARTINGKLTLTNGIFSLPTGTIFTIANGNTNTVGGAPFSATKHIATQVNYSTGAKGFLRVNNMAAAAAYLFPAGDGTNYLPVTLTPSGTLANNMFSVCSFVGLTVDGEPNGIPFTAAQKHNTVDAVWTVNYHGTGSPTAPSTNMTVGWPASLEGINFTAYPNPLIGIAHYGPVKWGTTVGTGDNNANTATRTNITQFSPFGVGKIDPAGGTLAIKIIYFNGSKGNNVNNLYWQAECTSSFAKFAIERSTNGVDFTGISVVTATQARCALPFNYNDYTAPEGNVYYRIRIIDVDGMVSYSAIVKLGSPVKAIELAGFMPNPVSNIAQLKINTTKPDVVNLVVIAMDGKILQRTTVILQPGSSIINMDMTRLPAAAYLLKGIFSDGESNAIKFIKQ